MTRYCLFLVFSLTFHYSLPQKVGRNVGEPDYHFKDILQKLRANGRMNEESEYNGSVDVEESNGGQDEGEPDYEPEVILKTFKRRFDGEDAVEVLDSVWENEANTTSSHPYLMMMPDDFEGHFNIKTRRQYDNDAVEVPDSVWDTERSHSNTRMELTETLRQSGNPPATACLNIRLIYNRGWVQSSASGNAALARQRALDVLAEAENIYNTKFSASNQLGTRIRFNIVGGAPQYDSTGSYQASGGSLASSSTRRWIDTSSYSTQHYAFLTGSDGGGAIGIAYLATACFRVSVDQRYKMSINEWHNNVANTGGVLAHEIGHALGIYHDFGSGGTSHIKYDSVGNRCTGINGVMDYGSRSSVDKFSTCSKENFSAWYTSVVSTYGSFCLACANIFDCQTNKIALRSHHGKYVVAESDGKANVDRASINAWETWTVIDLGGNKIALRSAHGKYLVAESNYEVNANRLQINAWEMFTVISQGNGMIALKTAHSRYVVAESDGRLMADRTWIREWERFVPKCLGDVTVRRPEIFDCPSKKIALKSDHGKYVVAESNGKANVNRSWIQAWETWTLVDLGGNKMALRSAHGKYLVAESNYEVNADRLQINAWETFTVVPQGSGKIALKTAHNRYVVAESDGRLRADRTWIREWEIFIPTCLD